MPRTASKKRNQHRPKPDAPTTDGLERLQKAMASAGVASRRECEQLILEGRVEVDRELVTELGTKVDATRQEIRVDGQVLARTRHVYYAVNKPKGFVSTNQDPAGRPRVIDLVPETRGRVFSVGRLDLESEGLILLTNDGDLANRLAHPRYGVAKTYQVQVAGHPDRETLARLKGGVRLAEGTVRALNVVLKRKYKQSTILEIILKEGKNREIRRMLAAQGHKVQKLRRIAIGSLKLGGLPVGEARMLAGHEIDALRRATRPAPKKKSPGKGRRR